jgi:NitT/TauT family transport system substrate-binding protein
MEKIPNLKPEIRDTLVLPTYRKAALPDNKYLEKIIGWTAKAVKKDIKVKADGMVERKFVK